MIACFDRSRLLSTSAVPSSAADISDVESLAPTLVDRPALTRTPATLVFTPRATEIQETIVISFLFLEKNRRIHEIEQTRLPSQMMGAVSMSAHC